jgi:hypothetical protein
MKLLLSEDFGSRWRWGFNLFYEQQIASGFKTESGFSQGIGCTVVDDRLNFGVEMNFEYTTENNVTTTTKFGISPSIQWLPNGDTHLDLVPLIGATCDNSVVEAWGVFGIDFGPGNECNKNAPIVRISARGR